MALVEAIARRDNADKGVPDGRPLPRVAQPVVESQRTRYMTCRVEIAKMISVPEVAVASSTCSVSLTSLQNNTLVIFNVILSRCSVMLLSCFSDILGNSES